MLDVLDGRPVDFHVVRARLAHYTDYVEALELGGEDMVRFNELCGPVLDTLERGYYVRAHELFMAAMEEVWPGWNISQSG